jgi:hypothetical protein
MKNLLISFLFLLPFHGEAQMIDAVNLAEQKEIEYISLIPILEGRNPTKANWAIGVDVGIMQKDGFVKDEAGNHQMFVSVVEALNKFHGWGWEFVQTYQQGNQTLYLLRRKK